MHGLENRAEGGTAAVAVEEVYFSYSEKMPEASMILSGVSLTVEFGEVVSLIGESGSGKTTLLNLIAKIIAPLAGVARTEGRVSFLQQDDYLLPYRTAWQNACLGLELSGGLSAAVIADAASILDRMKLIGSLDKLPSELSGGMRRRVALARQIVLPSDVLLLDEPLGEQDRAMRETLENILQARARELDNGIMVVTHDLESAVAISDRIMVLGSAKRIEREWSCPDSLRTMKPSVRRAQVQFADSVADVWRCLWEVTDRGEA